MSSGDELGGFDPSTPAPVTKKGPPPRAARQANRAVAGPSKPAAASNAAKKPFKPVKPVAEEEEAEAPDVVVLSSDEDGDDVPKASNKPKAAPKNKNNANSNPPPQPNGKTKAKGKSKADTSTADAMEVDEPQPAVEDEPPTLKPAKKPRPVAATKRASTSHTPPPAKRTKSEAVLDEENARLRRRIEELSAQRDRISKQLEETFEIRETEPEKLLNESVAQYETSLAAQQHLLQIQTAALAQLKALPESGKAQSMQFLSREAVDEETKDITARLRSLEQKLKEKDSRLAELQSSNQDLERQLQAEIQMAKEYREKNPAGPKAIANGSGKPGILTDAVVKLYEDLSNFLVTNVTRGKTPYSQFPDLQETTYKCTYSVVDNDSEGSNPSLTFTLRHMWTPLDEDTPITSKKDLIEKMEFTPQNLEHEADEFVARLDFLSTPFMFDRKQMHVFMRTLSERLSYAAGNDDAIEPQATEEDQLNPSQ